MRKLEQEPEIISMALALKLDPELGAVKEILRFCCEKIAKSAAKIGRIVSLEQLQEAVCLHLNLVIEEIWSEEDLTSVVKKYISMGEIVFATLRDELDDDTYASLMEREHIVAGAKDRYVAVIDCRGEKAARRYFTRWHEIAHLLTHVKQLELPFRRVHRSSVTRADPIERLMDIIAGEVGFFDPIFYPVLSQELANNQVLTFDGIQRIRDRLCPKASFQSALIACTKRSAIPTIVLEAKMAYKKAEEAVVRSRQMQMFGTVLPKQKLRAVESTQNPAARSLKFIIHRNIAIPAASIITKHFELTDDPEQSRLVASGDEELSIWRHTDGEAIGFGRVHIEAKRIGGTLTAIIQR